MYFFLFEGHEIEDSVGLDHLGIQFEDEDEMQRCRKRLEKCANLSGEALQEPGRWVGDPVEKLNWELFYKEDDNVF